MRVQEALADQSTNDNRRRDAPGRKGGYADFASNAERPKGRSAYFGRTGRTGRLQVRQRFQAGFERARSPDGNAPSAAISFRPDNSMNATARREVSTESFRVSATATRRGRG